MKNKPTIEERVSKIIENMDWIRTTQPDGTEFLEVKRTDLEQTLTTLATEIREEERERMETNILGLEMIIKGQSEQIKALMPLLSDKFKND